MQILYFSRFVQLVSPRVAMLGATALLGLLLIPFTRFHRGYGAACLFVGISAGLVALWMTRFVANTGMAGDPRYFFTIAGFLTFFPFLFLVQTLGVASLFRALHIVCIIYCCVYCVLAVLVIFAGFGPHFSAAVMVDPTRGRRLFADYSLIGFALFYQLASIRQGRGSLFLVACMVPTLLAAALAQERVSILLYAIGSISILLGIRNFRFLIGTAFLAMFVIYTAVALIEPGQIAALLQLRNDDSLGLRVQSFALSQYLFNTYPIFGLGLPGDADFEPAVIGLQYFPEDLGVLGLLGSYGLVGLCWEATMMAILYRAARTFDALRQPEFTTAAHVATMTTMTCAFSQNIIEGDGGMMLGLILATSTYLIPALRSRAVQFQAMPSNLDTIPTAL